MSIPAEGWFLYPQARGEPLRATLVRESFELSEPGEGQVVVEPLYGCWEGNMEHALARQPIDICRQRNEPKVIIGNCGLVRVTSWIGRGVTGVHSGQLAMIYSAAELDRWGYAKRILGYDAVGTMGCLTTRMLVPEGVLLPVPEGTRHPLVRWGAFALRHVTAWANWRLAWGLYRLMVSAEELPSPNVWGWGGGVSLATLQLAAHAGCRTAMLSGHDGHLEAIRAAGITAIDRRQFGQLSYDDERFAEDRAYRADYTKAEAAFLAAVEAHTAGAKVQVFVDYIGSPVFRATLKAMSREAVLTTAGWKAGMLTSFLRAQECIDHHQFIHTHNGRRADAVAAVSHGEAHGWLPAVDPQVFGFDAIPELAQRFAAGELGMFPAFSVNPP